jgi:DNA-binding transcriptional regulator PaaX
VSHLFEARTVLGRGPSEIVSEAWDFDQLNAVQHRFCKVYKENLRRLREEQVRPDAAVALARDEMEAYLCAMRDDPLLPSALLPEGYLGKQVWRLHQRVVKAIRRCL